MLTLEHLRERCRTGKSFDYLYFWGHQSRKDGKVTKSCFSQWYPSPFEIGEILYPTAEHWMMASKARLFDDTDTANRIVESSDPKIAKELGRTVSNFQQLVWQENARDLVMTGNLAKFSQNNDLGQFLVNTGETILVEASPNDRIWGIGLKAEDERSMDPETWLGENWLGFALMNVRDEMRNRVNA
ncbi:NADAR family protein [Planctomicrobium sp. SH661]|uniref:NADAR family protein n=1 Tax=Planctomicrobium sp. SH661 TaxID=3448124 RepID=UPI003F5B4FC0